MLESINIPTYCEAQEREHGQLIPSIINLKVGTCVYCILKQISNSNTSTDSSIRQVAQSIRKMALCEDQESRKSP